MNLQIISKDTISFPYGNLGYLANQHAYFVLYFEETISTVSDDFIKKNQDHLESLFAEKNRKFCYLPDLHIAFINEAKSAIDTQVLWSTEAREQALHFLSSFDYELFFDFFRSSFGIDSTISSGTLNHVGNFAVVPKDALVTAKEFLINLADEVSVIHPPRVYFSRGITTVEKTDMELQKEAFIKKMDDLLAEMKGHGVLHILSNYIYESIEKELSSDKIAKLTTLQITEKGAILFPEYNCELRLSHLTKTLYLFFLLHEQPVALSDLDLHTKELISIYKKVSYRNDVDALELSISELVKGNAEGVYVHISRIKAAVLQLFHRQVASYYFISGAKNEPRTLLLDKQYIDSQFY